MTGYWGELSILPFWGLWFILFLAALIIWDLVWRGIALWKAARNNDNIWFIFLLIINSVGILPIIYIFFFSKKRAKQAVPVKKAKRRR